MEVNNSPSQLLEEYFEHVATLNAIGDINGAFKSALSAHSYAAQYFPPTSAHVVSSRTAVVSAAVQLCHRELVASDGSDSDRLESALRWLSPCSQLVRTIPRITYSTTSQALYNNPALAVLDTHVARALVSTSATCIRLCQGRSTDALRIAARGLTAAATAGGLVPSIAATAPDRARAVSRALSAALTISALAHVAVDLPRPAVAHAVAALRVAHAELAGAVAARKAAERERKSEDRDGKRRSGEADAPRSGPATGPPDAMAAEWLRQEALAVPRGGHPHAAAYDSPQGTRPPTAVAAVDGDAYDEAGAGVPDASTDVWYSHQQDQQGRGPPHGAYVRGHTSRGPRSVVRAVRGAVHDAVDDEATADPLRARIGLVKDWSTTRRRLRATQRDALRAALAPHAECVVRHLQRCRAGVTRALAGGSGGARGDAGAWRDDAVATAAACTIQRGVRRVLARVAVGSVRMAVGVATVAAAAPAALAALRDVAVAAGLVRAACAADTSRGAVGDADVVEDNTAVPLLQLARAAATAATHLAMVVKGSSNIVAGAAAADLATRGGYVPLTTPVAPRNPSRRNPLSDLPATIGGPTAKAVAAVVAECIGKGAVAALRTAGGVPPGGPIVPSGVPLGGAARPSGTHIPASIAAVLDLAAVHLSAWMDGVAAATVPLLAPNAVTRGDVDAALSAAVAACDGYAAAMRALAEHEAADAERDSSADGRITSGVPHDGATVESIMALEVALRTRTLRTLIAFAAVHGAGDAPPRLYAAAAIAAEAAAAVASDGGARPPTAYPQPHARHLAGWVAHTRATAVRVSVADPTQGPASPPTSARGVRRGPAAAAAQQQQQSQSQRARTPKSHRTTTPTPSGALGAPRSSYASHVTPSASPLGTLLPDALASAVPPAHPSAVARRIRGAQQRAQQQQEECDDGLAPAPVARPSAARPRSAAAAALGCGATAVAPLVSAQVAAAVVGRVHEALCGGAAAPSASLSAAIARAGACFVAPLAVLLSAPQGAVGWHAMCADATAVRRMSAVLGAIVALHGTAAPLPAPFEAARVLALSAAFTHSELAAVAVSICGSTPAAIASPSFLPAVAVAALGTAADDGATDCDGDESGGASVAADGGDVALAAVVRHAAAAQHVGGLPPAAYATALSRAPTDRVATALVALTPPLACDMVADATAVATVVRSAVAADWRGSGAADGDATYASGHAVMQGLPPASVADAWVTSLRRRRADVDDCGTTGTAAAAAAVEYARRAAAEASAVLATLVHVSSDATTSGSSAQPPTGGLRWLSRLASFGLVGTAVDADSGATPQSADTLASFAAGVLTAKWPQAAALLPAGVLRSVALRPLVAAATATSGARDRSPHGSETAKSGGSDGTATTAAAGTTVRSDVIRQLGRCGEALLIGAAVVIGAHCRAYLARKVAYAAVTAAQAAAAHAVSRASTYTAAAEALGEADAAASEDVYLDTAMRCASTGALPASPEDRARLASRASDAHSAAVTKASEDHTRRIAEYNAQCEAIDVARAEWHDSAIRVCVAAEADHRAAILDALADFYGAVDITSENLRAAASGAPCWPPNGPPGVQLSEAITSLLSDSERTARERIEREHATTFARRLDRWRVTGPLMRRVSVDADTAADPPLSDPDACEPAASNAAPCAPAGPPRLARVTVLDALFDLDASRLVPDGAVVAVAAELMPGTLPQSGTQTSTASGPLVAAGCDVAPLARLTLGTTRASAQHAVYSSCDPPALVGGIPEDIAIGFVVGVRVQMDSASAPATAAPAGPVERWADPAEQYRYQRLILAHHQLPAVAYSHFLHVVHPPIAHAYAIPYHTPTALRAGSDVVPVQASWPPLYMPRSRSASLTRPRETLVRPSSQHALSPVAPAVRAMSPTQRTQSAVEYHHAALAASAALGVPPTAIPPHHVAAWQRALRGQRASGVARAASAGTIPRTHSAGSTASLRRPPPARAASNLQYINDSSVATGGRSGQVPYVMRMGGSAGEPVSPSRAQSFGQVAHWPPQQSYHDPSQSRGRGVADEGLPPQQPLFVAPEAYSLSVEPAHAENEQSCLHELVVNSANIQNQPMAAQPALETTTASAFGNSAVSVHNVSLSSGTQPQPSATWDAAATRHIPYEQSVTGSPLSPQSPAPAITSFLPLARCVFRLSVIQSEWPMLVVADVYQQDNIIAAQHKHLRDGAQPDPVGYTVDAPKYPPLSSAYPSQGADGHSGSTAWRHVGVVRLLVEHDAEATAVLAGHPADSAAPQAPPTRTGPLREHRVSLYPIEQAGRVRPDRAINRAGGAPPPQRVTTADSSAQPRGGKRHVTIVDPSTFRVSDADADCSPGHPAAPPTCASAGPGSDPAGALLALLAAAMAGGPPPPPPLHLPPIPPPYPPAPRRGSVPEPPMPCDPEARDGDASDDDEDDVDTAAARANALRLGVVVAAALRAVAVATRGAAAVAAVEAARRHAHHAAVAAAVAGNSSPSGKMPQRALLTTNDSSRSPLSLTHPGQCAFGCPSGHLAPTARHAAQATSGPAPIPTASAFFQLALDADALADAIATDVAYDGARAGALVGLLAAGMVVSGVYDQGKAAAFQNRPVMPNRDGPPRILPSAAGKKGSIAAALVTSPYRSTVKVAGDGVDVSGVVGDPSAVWGSTSGRSPSRRAPHPSDSAGGDGGGPVLAPAAIAFESFPRPYATHDTSAPWLRNMRRNAQARMRALAAGVASYAAGVHVQVVYQPDDVPSPHAGGDVQCYDNSDGGYGDHAAYDQSYASHQHEHGVLPSIGSPGTRAGAASRANTANTAVRTATAGDYGYAVAVAPPTGSRRSSRPTDTAQRSTSNGAGSRPATRPHTMAGSSRAAPPNAHQKAAVARAVASAERARARGERAVRVRDALSTELATLPPRAYLVHGRTTRRLDVSGKIFVDRPHIPIVAAPPVGYQMAARRAAMEAAGGAARAAKHWVAQVDSVWGRDAASPPGGRKRRQEPGAPEGPEHGRGGGDGESADGDGKELDGALSAVAHIAWLWMQLVQPFGMGGTDDDEGDDDGCADEDPFPYGPDDDGAAEWEGYQDDGSPSAPRHGSRQAREDPRVAPPPQRGLQPGPQLLRSERPHTHR